MNHARALFLALPLLVLSAIGGCGTGTLGFLGGTTSDGGGGMSSTGTSTVTTTTTGSGGIGGTGGTGGIGGTGGTGGTGGGGHPSCEPTGQGSCSGVAPAWGQRLGNAEGFEQFGYSVVAGPSGDLFVAGVFVGRMTVPPCSDSLPLQPGRSLFVARLDGAEHKCSWSRYFNTIQVRAMNIDITPDGKVICGGVASEPYNLGGGLLGSQGLSTFVLALDGVTGDHVWSKSFHATNPYDMQDNEIGRWVTVDPVKSRIFVLADFGPHPNEVLVTDAGGSSPLGVMPVGDRDTLVAALESDGTPIWSRMLGAPKGDVRLRAAAVHGSELVLAGDAYVSSLPLAPVNLPGCSLTSHGDIDVLVAGLDISDGGAAGADLSWCGIIGGTSADAVHDLTVTSQGDILLSGTLDGDVVEPDCVSTPAGAGSADAFILRFDTSSQGPSWIHRFAVGASHAEIYTSLAPWGEGCAAFATLWTEGTASAVLRVGTIAPEGGEGALGNYDLLMSSAALSNRFRPHIRARNAGEIVLVGSFADQFNLGLQSDPLLKTSSPSDADPLVAGFTVP